ncbi:hypothetical protein ACP70R_007029 [Stipagrostis hirtigluma subsp. patula]
MAPEKTKKKRGKEQCIINHLPSDLIERIFLRLPVSTLLRCIGVCKQWYNFIRDPQFVTSHLQHAPRCTLLFFPQEPVSSNHFLSDSKLFPSDAIIIDEAWSQSKWSVPVIGPDDFLCGSCNGLLCLYTKGSTTMKIANIATGECLNIDKPAKKLRGDNFSFYNFGFHPITKEYKVLHFLGVHRNYSPSQGTFSIIQLYTLGTDKWIPVRTTEALSLSCLQNSGVVNVDGSMYWLTEDTGASWKHTVISFDLSEEAFARIQLPATSFEVSDSRLYWMIEIDGKVCIATAEFYRHLPRMLAGDLQIWTLDNKVEQRWSQKWNIQHAPNYIPGPHFFHRDKILMQDQDSDLYSYELVGKNCEKKMSNMVRLLDFRPRKPENMQSYVYVKSLVRLDAYKKVGNVHKTKRREGWKLKKWEAWESMLGKIEDWWSKVHQLEQQNCVVPRHVAMKAKEILQRLPADVIEQHTCTEINEILEHLPHCPDQYPMPLRRLNWVEWKGDLEKLLARLGGLEDNLKATKQAHEVISTTLTYVQDYLQTPHGISGAAADTSSQ